MLCLSQADAAFGEWADQAVTFEVRRDEAADEASKAAASLLSDILLRVERQFAAVGTGAGPQYLWRGGV